MRFELLVDDKTENKSTLSITMRYVAALSHKKKKVSTVETLQRC